MYTHAKRSHQHLKHPAIHDSFGWVTETPKQPAKTQRQNPWSLEVGRYTEEQTNPKPTHKLSTHIKVSLHSSVIVAVAESLAHEVAVVENVIGHQRLHVGDVPLFCRTLACRVNQPRVGHQVTLVVHQETPEVIDNTGVKSKWSQVISVRENILILKGNLCRSVLSKRKHHRKNMYTLSPPTTQTHYPTTTSM